MSHSVNIKTQFKNTENLLSQFVKLGWVIERNTKCVTYPSDPRRNEVHQYVAKNPNKGYDVGINIDENADAYFVCDFFDPSIERALGKNLSTIKQGYSLDELKKFFHEEDMEYNVNRLETGELVITAGE